MATLEDGSFDGWRGFAFGMAFDDALTAPSGLVWDAGSVRRCRDEMAARGCALSATDGSGGPATTGVALRPRLVFNQQGRLAAVRLWWRSEAKIDVDRCEHAFGRLLDELHESWGTPTDSTPNTRGALSRSTPEGRPFRLGSEDGASFGRQVFAARPDGRRIDLQFHRNDATGSAPATCRLGIDYRGPESLQPPPEQRPHPLKNWY